MQESDSKEIEILWSTGPEILALKQVTLAFFTVHVYDHILTLPFEIEYMWKRNFSLGSVIFFINRYYSPAFFFIITFTRISPFMNPKICEHFAIFLPIAGGIVLTIVPNMLVALRVYALYQKNRVVQIFLAIYLVSELGIALWIYLTPGHHPLELPPLYQNHKVLYLCTEDTADSLGRWRPSTFQLMQVVYDVIVLILVFFKTKWPRESRHGIFDIIFNQGVIYFICVFSANLVWVLMILVGPETLKYIAACPTLVMACTMANRITLDLREYAQRPVINSSVSLDSHANANGQYTGQYTIRFKTPRTPPPPPPDLESQQSRAESDRSTIYNSEDEYDFQRPLEPTTLPFFDKPVGSGVRDG